jgi:hypothetical protein
VHWAFTEERRLEHCEQVKTPEDSSFAWPKDGEQVNLPPEQTSDWIDVWGKVKSGNGREGGRFGLEDFMQVKTIHRPQ